MHAYARLVKTAWATWAPGMWQPLPIGTRFAFRRDEHGHLRACFVEYDHGGFVQMLQSHIVDETRRYDMTECFDMRPT